MRQVLFYFLLSPFFLSAQSLSEAEAQISFAKESRSHDYYVKQAALWWQEIEKSPKDEMAWWNYYRACRNAEGSAGWNPNFVNHGPHLRVGSDIVALMEEAIPGTFIYHYVKGSTGGVDPQAGDHLLKAYEMNPDFPGLLAPLVTYSISTHNEALRKEANMRWYRSGDYSAAWLDFAYNLLQSVEPNGILLTQGDNDSYPLWMLQDALAIRTDVQVINIDFLLYAEFQEPTFAKLGLEPFKFEKIEIGEFAKNWQNVSTYFLDQYSGERPLHISFTVNQANYKDFKEQLYVRGFSYRLSKNGEAKNRNLELFREVFRWDSVLRELELNPSAARLKEMQQHYALFLESLETFKTELAPWEVQKIEALKKITGK